MMLFTFLVLSKSQYCRSRFLRSMWARLDNINRMTKVTSNIYLVTFNQWDLIMWSNEADDSTHQLLHQVTFIVLYVYTT